MDLRTLFAVFITSFVVVGSALAQSPGLVESLTPYERKHVEHALAGQGLILAEPKDEQAIEFVAIEKYSVFVDFEAWPTFPNMIHMLTEDRVIRRELLFKPGDSFRRLLAEETVRNLRRLGIFAVAVIVPVRHSESGRFGLLVVTRDLWSLRLESQLQFTGQFVDQLSAQLTERNLFGLGKLITARWIMDPFTYTAGGVYNDPRVMGRRYALFASTDAIFSRDDGRYDGFKSYLSLSRPFYNFGQKWGFGSYVFFQRLGGRQTQQGQLLAYDDPETMEEERIPRVWESESITGEITGRYQTGRRVITRLSAGFGALDYRAYSISRSNLDQYSRATQQRFRDAVLPESQSWFYPTFNASFFANRYRSYVNLSGYAFSEYVQLGLSGGLAVRAPLAEFGSSQDLVLVGGHLVYRESYIGDGLIELAGGVEARLNREEDSVRDRRYLARTRIASPWFRTGRLILRSDLLYFDDPIRQYPITLGGDNGLRGFPSQFFASFGGGRLRANAEFRSAPVSFLSLRGGLVGFYDAGRLFNGSHDYGYQHAVGLGFRMIVPQASRFTYRLDFGVPLDGTGFMVTVSGETNQAVPMTAQEDVISPDATSIGGLVNQP